MYETNLVLLQNHVESIASLLTTRDEITATKTFLLLILRQGRSAFEPPLRDENGDFILGPYVHQSNRLSYAQKWDDRGHPFNPESKASAKRLRKAQNEVLQACGVIVHNDTRVKSDLDNLRPETAVEIITEENKIGVLLKGIDRISALMMTWGIASLRRRIMVSPLSSLTNVRC